jgi:sensor histidine kinase YesM
MKHNTSELKTHLMNALRAAPNDFSLSEVRGLISRALGLVETVEDKRHSREVRRQDRAKSSNTFVNPLGTLNYLDKELAEQQKKLKELENRQNQTEIEEDGGNGLQNVFG